MGSFTERGRVPNEITDVCRAMWVPDPVVYEGRLTTIASSVTGPEPARPILPLSLSRKSMTGLVDRADGWTPITMAGTDQPVAEWRR